MDLTNGILFVNKRKYRMLRRKRVNSDLDTHLVENEVEVNISISQIYKVFYHLLWELEYFQAIRIRSMSNLRVRVIVYLKKSKSISILWYFT